MSEAESELGLEESEDVGRNPTGNPTLGDIVSARYNRRDVLRGALGVSAIAATVSPLALLAGRAQAQASRFVFEEVSVGSDDRDHVASGYSADVLIGWGDPVLADAPRFDPHQQSGSAQKRQFGYNNDYLGYFPIRGASDPSRNGLLVVNHEYTNAELMFSGVRGEGPRRIDLKKITGEHVAIEMAAHGGSVIEVRRENGRWRVVKDSHYARRIDAETPMAITGPAAGHARMQTPEDPAGTRVRGMLNNCAGGTTPWGTWLTCEENFHFYFLGELAEDHPEARNHKRYGVPVRAYMWGRHHPRFDVSQNANEANRFGWVVEIEPFDPGSTPKKRTALGRFKHEGAAGIVNKDGRYVLYSGDDERFEYVYRFVSRDRFDPARPQANRDLLDEGTLSVARYDADGSVTWMPLVFGTGPLTAANGFASQADVLIETRRAADLLGATKMDRPEDVEANARTQAVYVVLTGNDRRKLEQTDAANPRPENRFGHIIEMIPPDGDHAADRFAWDILLRCGDPSIAEVGATFSAATTKDGWFANPDNVAIDAQGRLWVATDGNSLKKSGRTDGVWALETEGAARGTSRCFYRAPVGAELCGPCFTPDDETLFVAVQHPGESADEGQPPPSFETPPTRWPDFKADMPPRPSVVAITKKGGGKIAS